MQFGHIIVYWGRPPNSLRDRMISHAAACPLGAFETEYGNANAAKRTRGEQKSVPPVKRGMWGLFDRFSCVDDFERDDRLIVPLKWCAWKRFCFLMNEMLLWKKFRLSFNPLLRKRNSGSFHPPPLPASPRRKPRKITRKTLSICPSSSCIFIVPP